MTNANSNAAGSRLLAAIELGGSKIVAAVGRSPLSSLKCIRIPTAPPDESLAKLQRFFDECRREFGPIHAAGAASFGPIELDVAAPKWGRLGETPKSKWSGFDLAGGLQKIVDCPVLLQTDVNAAALAEARLGAGRGFPSLVYITVGTGVGGGIYFDSTLHHGVTHPELGHIPLRRHGDDDFTSSCRFHADCAEGLVSGEAIMQRFGVPLCELPEEHPFRELFVSYMAQLCVSLWLVLSPARIVIGGGVMTHSALHSRIEQRASAWLNGYTRVPGDRERPFVVPPALENSGLVGSFLLADMAHNQSVHT